MPIALRLKKQPKAEPKKPTVLDELFGTLQQGNKIATQILTPMEHDEQGNYCFPIAYENPFFGLLRARVESLIRYRDRLPEDSMFYPSEFWQHFVVYLNFIRYLPEHELKMIRAHTSFITGAYVYGMIHSPARKLTDAEKKRDNIMHAHLYDMLTQELPDAYHLTEPSPDQFTQDLCMPYRDKFLSEDLIRYQRCIANLYGSGVFQALDEHEKPHVTMVEIGTGYGGMAHHIKNSVNKPSTYILVDIPEMLFWSGTYLTYNNPDAKIYIFDAENPRPLSQQELEQYDFVLVPNYYTKEFLEPLDIQLAVNLLSFQEMTDEQIRYYAKSISDSLTGWLYTENFAKHISNPWLKKPVLEVLREFVDTAPGAQEYEEIIQRLDREQGEDVWRLYPSIATSIANPMPLKRQKSYLFQGAGYQMDYENASWLSE